MNGRGHDLLPLEIFDKAVNRIAIGKAVNKTLPGICLLSVKRFGGNPENAQASILRISHGIVRKRRCRIAAIGIHLHRTCGILADKSFIVPCQFNKQTVSRIFKKLPSPVAQAFRFSHRLAENLFKQGANSVFITGVVTPYLK
ncbi:MAG: hypothetical protein BWY08_01383 [Bacteroidetes bacterium ADurb.Bin174]|nr:MAG: hypothetical protein BWY08_01383 [Bacteroidetes bacterium ADurb.Bin174]